MPGYNSQRRGTACTSQISFNFFYCYVCSVLCILCTVCVQIFTVLLPPGVNPIAVIYIYIIYHILYPTISYHIVPYHIIGSDEWSKERCSGKVMRVKTCTYDVKICNSSRNAVICTLSSTMLTCHCLELTDMALFRTRVATCCQTANTKVSQHDGSTNFLCRGLIELSGVGRRRVLNSNL
jgi:hypothetical protein